MSHGHRSGAALLLVMSVLACTSPSPAEPSTRVAPRSGLAPTPAPASCPSPASPELRAPDVTAPMEAAEFWLAKLEPGQAEAVLLGPSEREVIAARVAATPGSWRDPIDPALADPVHVEAELSERLEWLRGRVASGKYIEGQAGALEQAAATIADATPVAESEALRWVVAETPLWCVPTRAGLYTAPVDADFDRNQCASLHLADLVRVIRRGDAWAYVDAGHSVGWIELEPAPLGPALDREALVGERQQPHGFVLADYPLPEHPELTLRAGTRLLAEGLLPEGLRLRVPTAEGSITIEAPADAPIQATPLPFTRKALFEQAFAQLGDPYGWGGRAGFRDCSSLLFDLFAQFDLLLGRNSAVQSQLGVHTIEVAGQSDEAKRAAIRAAAERGAVLLYMSGHIMLYLGHDASSGVDHDYALSAISDYLVPCPDGSDTAHRFDRVVVSTLELGRASERKAYLERIDRLAVFGPVGE